MLNMELDIVRVLEKNAKEFERKDDESTWL